MKSVPTYRVPLAEIQTGILLESPGVRALNRQRDEIARWFPDLEAARAFAAETIAAHPDVECHVQQADGLTIEQVRDVDAFGRWQASQVEAPRRSWWERMRMRFRRGP